MDGTPNLIPTNRRSKAEAKELGAKGGRASGKARREKKALRDILREALEQDAGNGLNKMQFLVAKCITDHAAGKFDVRDLKLLQDILGESITNVNITRPDIVVGSQAEADAINEILDKK